MRASRSGRIRVRVHGKVCELRGMNGNTANVSPTEECKTASLMFHELNHAVGADQKNCYFADE